MGIDTVENIFTLLVVIFGLLYSLFKYVKTPKYGWVFISIFFMTHLLSDYYWAIYALVMGEDPEVSALIAYFGWNASYAFLLLLILHMREEKVKGFFHPVMLLPIPLGIIQFLIYLPFGGIFNNIWEGVLVTAIQCFSLQTIIYYLKHKKEDFPFPWLYVVVLAFSVFEYGMWTSSCFSWPDLAHDPYYYFALLECLVLSQFGWATGKAYEAKGFIMPKKSAQETQFEILLQVTIAVLIFFGCVSGYYIGLTMKQTLPAMGASEINSHRHIAITLFVVSIILVFFILFIIMMTAMRYKKIGKDTPEEAAKKRGKFNFIFTIVITLLLMVTSLIYTSRLFYRVSVTGVLENGKSKAYSMSDDLENYLGVARSVLWVTADNVEIMLQYNEPQEKIVDYIYRQTANQAEQFDENFTGIYAYINGEYMDGSGWQPPEGYVVEERDWYKEAVKANGKTIIVSPYIDADTGSPVITIAKMLNDKKGATEEKNRPVVALDMVVNHVQDITEEMNIAGKGYAMVINHDGMIIAHKDVSLNGKNVKDIYGSSFMNIIKDADDVAIDAKLDGVNTRLFVDQVINQWYVVIAIPDEQLLAETNMQRFVNVFVSLIIFLLISFFYFLGYKNEKLNAEKVEEMRSENLRKEYEAVVLKQKEAAADEANRAKSQFLAQMSHEIRTPINAVLGMNEMILRSSDDKEILEYASNIDSAGNTLLSLINTILDFSKIEDGKMDIIPVNYDTSSFINDLVNSIIQRADAKGLELKLEIDETLPCELFGDDVRLSQVIMNLLTNAVKYTEKGQVTFTMNGALRKEDKIRIYVAVKDTGMGIREEDIDRLCASFERLDVKKNRNIEGTGLGMSIVTSLLEMMGSRINVESTYGEGSLFYLAQSQILCDG